MILIRFKVISSPDPLGPRVVHSVTSHLAELERESYQKQGKSSLASTAMVFFCSGSGTRLVASKEHPKPLAKATPSGKVPLELLLRSTPKEIPRIIISVPPGDNTIKQYLKEHQFYGFEEEKFLFVDQPMTKTDILKGEEMPAGTGAVVMGLVGRIKSGAPELSGIQNMILMDGEKTGFNPDVLASLLGFHIQNKNDLTTACYSLDAELRTDKKFAHIDTEMHRAYSGKESPDELLKKEKNHLLGGGVYVINRGIALAPLRATQESKTITLGDVVQKTSFPEIPMISIVEATSGRLGYYEVIRGDLGSGIKKRESIPANISIQSEANKARLAKQGWTLFPTSFVEMYGATITGKNSDTTLKDGANLFLSGAIQFGQANELYGRLSFSADDKQIDIGDANSFVYSTVGGSVTIGDSNDLNRVIILADNDGRYSGLIPEANSPFSTSRQRDLIRMITDDLNFHPSGDSYIKIGTNCSLKDCLIIGNVVIEDNVRLQNTVIIGSPERPTLVREGTVGENFYVRDSTLDVKNITGDRSVFVGSSIFADRANKCNVKDSIVFAKNIDDSTIKDSLIEETLMPGITDKLFEGALTSGHISALQQTNDQGYFPMIGGRHTNSIENSVLINIGIKGNTIVENSILKNTSALMTRQNVPDGTTISDSLIADSYFRTTGLQISTEIENCHIVAKRINKGATLHFYNSDKQLGASNLTDNHLMLAGFINKYVLENSPDRCTLVDINFLPMVESEHQILRHFLGARFDVLAGQVDLTESIQTPLLDLKLILVKLVDNNILDHAKYIVSDYTKRWLELRKKIEVENEGLNPARLANFLDNVGDQLKLAREKLFGYRPGLFIIQQAETEYANIIKSLDDHIDYLLGPQNTFTDVVFDKGYIREVMRAFIGLRLNHVIGMPIVDMLTVQEVKQVLHSILNTYLSKADVSEKLKTHHRDKINEITGLFIKVRDEFIYQYKREINVEDWFRLATISNIYDYSTQAVREFISQIHSPEALFRLMDSGQIFPDVFSAVTVGKLKQAGLVDEVDTANDYIQFTPLYNRLLLESISLTDKEKSYIQDIHNLCMASLRNLRLDTRFTESMKDVIGNLMTAPVINFFVDNAGELVFDLELICQILAARKNSGNVLPDINLIARHLPIENDVDTETLGLVISHHFPDLKREKLINITQQHTSTMLGHDLRKFDPALIDRLSSPTVFNMGKGLGNLITMQNVPFRMTHVFTSKGVVGRRMIGLIPGYNEAANVPVILAVEAGSTFSPQYINKFLKRKP